MAPVADQRLLKLLTDCGKLDAATAAAVAKSMTDRSLSAIDAILENHVLSEHEIASTVAEELKLPLVDLLATPCAPNLSAVVSRETASHLGLVPCRVEDGTLVVAMVNPLDKEALGYLASSTGLDVRPTVATASQVAEAMVLQYDGRRSLTNLLADASADNAFPVLPASRPDLEPTDVRAISHEAEQAPIVKIVNMILLDAFKAEASDIHLEPGPHVVAVRFRIDGILENTLEFPRWAHAPIVARIKIMSKLDITERRVPQDGHLAFTVGDKRLDVRVSSMPTTYGEKIVMRVLDPSTAPRRLAEIGLSDADLALLRGVIQRPEGMILLTGPTGSGKTTTLYAIVQELLSPELNIVTIENPVEYELPGVAQTSINEKQGLTFAQVLRSELRQDPDVILIGEIRDHDTAEIAFQAAQTGHLVLSTVHTNDSVATVTRLLDLGVQAQIMAPSLLAVISQRLVRRVCSNCSEPTTLDEETARALALPAGQPIRRGRGCPNCSHTGFRGRTGCYEVLRITKGLEQLIAQKASESDIRALAEDEGMRPIVEDARAKIIAGITTPAEVLRVVEVDDRRPKCPKCGNSIEANFTACPFCHTPLKLACASCGAALKRKWTMCPFCGTARVPSPTNGARLPEAAPSRRELGTITVPKILVVDDDETIVDLLQMTLKRSRPPMEVETALSGEEALAKLRSGPHLVILDLMMPGMDGYEVCRRMRADLSTALIPVLMLTALADADSRRLGFLAGTDDYVVKPFDRADLVHRVHQLLRRTYGWSPESPGTPHPVSEHIS